jgi:DnaK suppressor protein
VQGNDDRQLVVAIQVTHPQRSSPLSDEDRARLQRAIQSERKKTEGRIAAAKRSFEDIIRYSEGSPPDDEHDPEGATIGFERAQISALLAHAESHLAGLVNAERRLSSVDYGICERCGVRIFLDRLLARPTARACANCSDVCR